MNPTSYSPGFLLSVIDQLEAEILNPSRTNLQELFSIFSYVQVQVSYCSAMECLTCADVWRRADKSVRIVAAPCVIQTRCIFISLIFTLTSVPKWVKWTLTRVVQTCQVSTFYTLWTRLLKGIEEYWKVLQEANTRSWWCGNDRARVEGAFEQATGQRWWVIVECATLDIEIAC
jgi:hypothetical protein